MNEETTVAPKNPIAGLLYKTDEQLQAEAGIPPVPAGDSRIYNVSVRAWLVLVMMLTVCYMSVKNIPIQEPLYGAFLLGIGFYLGQKKS